MHYKKKMIACPAVKDDDLTGTTTATTTRKMKKPFMPSLLQPPMD